MPPTFLERVEDVKPSKNDINHVIMDYLITEGYPAAARKFAAEANLLPQGIPMSDPTHIEKRVEIRNSILAGNIQHAIVEINELNQDLLEDDQPLHFALLRLQLIELIKVSIATPDGDPIPPIEFAQDHVGPRCPKDPATLKELEYAMALLIYPKDKMSPPMLALLDPELRRGIANRVNVALLDKDGHRSQTRLKSLVKLKVWAEKRAREQELELPGKLGIWEENNKGGHSTDVPMTGTIAL